jgi:hypothetical protein
LTALISRYCAIIGVTRALVVLGSGLSLASIASSLPNPRLPRRIG